MKILYAHDGAGAAIAAGELITLLFNRDAHELGVVSVAERGFPHPDHLIYRLDPIRSRIENAQAIVDFGVESLRKEGFTVHGSVREGDPARELLALANEESYDLVVIGAGHRSWLGGVLLGSVSNRVLHTADRSVLVVRRMKRSSDGQLPRVVLGIDGSEGSSRAVEVMTGLLDPERCKVDVMSIVPDPPPPVALPGLTLSIPDPAPAEAEFEGFVTQGHALVRDIAEGLRAAGFTVETDVRVGSPSSVILEEAEDATLVSVGSRGLGSFRRAIIGSVSEAVVRHANATLVAH